MNFDRLVGGASPTKGRCTGNPSRLFRLGFHNRIEAMPSPRSFPRPWSVIEIPGGYRVDDASGQRLGYFYSWDDFTAKYYADVLTGDEARRMAEDFANFRSCDSSRGHRPCPRTVSMYRPMAAPVTRTIASDGPSATNIPTQDFASSYHPILLKEAAKQSSS